MNVLVACEFSGSVRDAFIAHGHNAWSCDLEDAPPEGLWPECHLVGDVRQYLHLGWDLMIAHPPCTYIANSSAKHLYKDMNYWNGPNEWRWQEMRKGAQFFKELMLAPIKRKCLENPKMLGYAIEIIGRKQSQMIQPWQFGHLESKETWLWLEELPPLVETNNVYEEMMKLPKRVRERVHHMSPGKNRGRERSRFFDGIADAMASQWGVL